MGILIVAATQLEINPLLTRFNTRDRVPGGNFTYGGDNDKPEFLVTGVGMVATVYHLTRKLCQQKFDLVVNAGIAGSFNENFTPGMVVNVTDECTPGFGAENEKGFKSVFDLGFYHPDKHPFTKGKLRPQKNLPERFVNQGLLSLLPVVSGMTSDTISGTAESAKKMKDLSQADIETMEGAAFFFVCLLEKVPFVQIRAISNKVGESDKSGWNIPLAIENLNKEIFQIFIEKNQ